MPLPSANDVKAVDRPLSNFSQAIIQSETNFVADRVFPITPTLQRSDRYYIFNQGDFARTDAEKREASAVAPVAEYRLSTDTFRSEVWHIRVPVDDQVEANADDVLDLQQSAVRRVTLDLLIRKEVDWVSTFFTTGVWTGVADETLSGANQWDKDGSKPIDAIHTKLYSVQAATGFFPNVAVMGPNVVKRLKRHPDVLDVLKYTSVANVSTQQLATVLNLDRIYELRAVRNTGTKGAATNTIAHIAGNHALFCYVDPNAGLMGVTSGKTFVWSRFPGGGMNGMRIRRYYSDPESTTWIEGQRSFDHKVVAGVLGCFVSSAVAS